MKLKKRNPESVADYYLAVQEEGKSKAAAYREHIDDSVKHPSMAARALELSDLYIKVEQEYMMAQDLQIKAIATRIKRKAGSLYEKVLDRSDTMLDEAKTSKETKEAMGVIRENLSFGGSAAGVKEPHQDYDAEGLIE